MTRCVRKSAPLLSLRCIYRWLYEGSQIFFRNKQKNYYSAGALPQTPPRAFSLQYQMRFVSRTTSPLCHFVTFPLSMNGEGKLYVAFDLLSVPSIRTVHRTVLISAPLEPTIIYCFFITLRNSQPTYLSMGPLSPISLSIDFYLSPCKHANTHTKKVSIVRCEQIRLLKHTRLAAEW